MTQWAARFLFIIVLVSTLSTATADNDTARSAIQADENTPFYINAGLNDAWYNPATGGQGFFISVFP